MKEEQKGRKGGKKKGGIYGSWYVFKDPERGEEGRKKDIGECTWQGKGGRRETSPTSRVLYDEKKRFQDPFPKGGRKRMAIFSFRPRLKERGNEKECRKRKEGGKPLLLSLYKLGRASKKKQGAHHLKKERKEKNGKNRFKIAETVKKGKKKKKICALRKRGGDETSSFMLPNVSKGEEEVLKPSEKEGRDLYFLHNGRKNRHRGGAQKKERGVAYENRREERKEKKGEGIGGDRTPSAPSKKKKRVSLCRRRKEKRRLRSARALRLETERSYRVKGRERTSPSQSSTIRGQYKTAERGERKTRKPRRWPAFRREERNENRRPRKKKKGTVARGATIPSEEKKKKGGLRGPREGKPWVCE